MWNHWPTPSMDKRLSIRIIELSASGRAPMSRVRCDQQDATRSPRCAIAIGMDDGWRGPARGDQAGDDRGRSRTVSCDPRDPGISARSHRLAWRSSYRYDGMMMSRVRARKSGMQASIAAVHLDATSPAAKTSGEPARRDRNNGNCHQRVCHERDRGRQASSELVADKLLGAEGDTEVAARPENAGEPVDVLLCERIIETEIVAESGRAALRSRPALANELTQYRDLALRR